MEVKPAVSLLRSLAGYVKEGFALVNHSSGLVLRDIAWR